MYMDWWIDRNWLIDIRLLYYNSLYHGWRIEGNQEQIGQDQWQIDL